MTADAFNLDAPVIRCSNCGGPQESATAKTCRYCSVALGAVTNGVAGAPWTLFWDMHSGGGTKVDPYEHIYIQAPEAEAKVVFHNRFGRDPEQVTCPCCGGDYAIDEEPTLARSSAYHRNLRYSTRVLANGEAPSAGEQGRYLEPGEAFPIGFTAYKFHYVRDEARPEGLTLREYTRQPHVKVIPESEILKKERT